ncbi:hypothetical protein ACS0PU_005616 [Formica fusca]
MEDLEHKSTSISASPRFVTKRPPGGYFHFVWLGDRWRSPLEYNSEEVFWSRNARKDIPTSANSLEAL